MHQNYENIPEKMRQVPFIVTRNKIPQHPQKFYNVSFTKNEHQIPFQNAVKIADDKNLEIGIPLTNTGFACVDIDGCINDEGIIAPEAMEIVEYIKSYTEISVSGRGLHIFVIGKKVQSNTYNDALPWCKRLEIFDSNKQIVLTGRVLPNYEELTERQGELTEVELKYLVKQKNDDKLIREDLSDEKYIEIGLKKDKIFQEYFYGGRKNKDESRDDFALLGKCMYWSNNNVSIALETFFKSPHVKQKDNAHAKKIERQAYIASIINKFRSNRVARDDRKFLTKDFIENRNNVSTKLQKLKPETYDFTDVGNAELFNKIYGESLVYNITLKGWMYYGK